ncbi:MAG TPA: 50S ribosomal protein L11 methyltransferase [Acidimicrobiales bacterium]|jgi:ribosomal protein L11 methyltransferase|nr:50S ribosomal protein L11 methyltransferase [Acidimicrobiales bacterium]
MPSRPPGVAVVRVDVPAGAEAELAADALWQAGAVAVEERRSPGGGVLLVAGVAPGDDVERLLAAVAPRWPAEMQAVDLDGALDAWRAHARAVTVGERLLVRPPWVPAPPGAGRAEVVVDPGRAFGSGTHASTRLALAALDRLVRGGERVLDAGCGSGVLGIAALALGAGHAVGVDRDPAALEASRANAAPNAVEDRLVVTPAPLDDVVASEEPFDLVVANLLLPDLVEMAPALRAALADGGTLVVSGVLVGQRGPVNDAAAALGLVPAGEDTDDGWLAVTLTCLPNRTQPAGSSR